MERIASTPLPIPINTTRLAASSSPPEEKYMAKSSSPPKVYWTRHFDRYELFRSDPADWYTGHNYHETEVFGANLNAMTQWKLGRTSMGVEFETRSKE